MYSVLAFVRKIQVFARYHLWAISMIGVTVTTCFVAGGMEINEFGNQLFNSKPIGLNHSLPFINPTTWSDCIGFGVYAYEGIGLILPVQDVTNDPKKYINIVRAVFVSVLIIYLVFGLFMLDSFGSLNTTPLATDFLVTRFAPHYWIANVITVLFMTNLVFTFPL